MKPGCAVQQLCGGSDDSESSGQAGCRGHAALREIFGVNASAAKEVDSTQRSET